MNIKTNLFYSWFDCGCGGNNKTVYIRSLTGITGPTGATGVTGPAGPVGSAGPTGATEQVP